MEDKFYSGGTCYYVCGNTDAHITTLNAIAQAFADEIGVGIENVRYEGLIANSDWCRNFQLFSAPSLTQPSNYHLIDVRASEYLKSR